MERDRKGTDRVGDPLRDRQGRTGREGQTLSDRLGRIEDIEG